MMRLKGMKRFLSVVLCAAILTGGVYSGTGVVKSVPVSAMTLAELQSEKQANADEGAEMMGYCPWSAIDLVSTHEGITKRYGFIYVNRDEFDMKDLARYRKDSFYWYKKVIETNGEDLS